MVEKATAPTPRRIGPTRRPSRRGCRTRSLWPALIAHATVNTCLIEAPTLIAAHPNTASVITGEGGILTVITVGLAAALISRFANWEATSDRKRSHANQRDRSTTFDNWSVAMLESEASKIGE